MSLHPLSVDFYSFFI